MSKEDKYSLGYAICNSIQNNKDKIEKLERQLKNQKNRNKKLNLEAQKYFDMLMEAEHLLDIANKKIDGAIEYIEYTHKYSNLRRTQVLDILLGILKGDSNE